MFRAAVLAVICAVAVAFAPMAPRMVRTRVEMSAGKAAAAVIASLLTVAPVFAADIEAGASVFNGNCAACHAGGNNVIQNEKTLRKEALDQYLEGGLKTTSIVYQVTNGKNAMPAFGGRLDPEDIENVAAYVFDQATGGKWD